MKKYFTLLFLVITLLSGGKLLAANDLIQKKSDLLVAFLTAFQANPAR